MVNAKRLCAIFFVLFNLAIFIPNIYRSCVKVKKLKNEISLLECSQRETENKIKFYDEEIVKLSDISNREKFVRNKLQMVKPGEIIYRVTD